MSDKHIQIIRGRSLIIAGCNLKQGDIVKPSHPRYAAILRACPTAASHVASDSRQVTAKTRILVTDEDDLMDIRAQTEEERFPNLNGNDPSKLLAVERARNLELANTGDQAAADQAAQIAARSMGVSSTVSEPRLVDAPETVRVNADPSEDDLAAAAALSAPKRKPGRPKKEDKTDDKAPDSAD